MRRSPRQLDDLEWRGVQREPFVALCAELGFETVGSRVHRWAPIPLIPSGQDHRWVLVR